MREYFLKSKYGNINIIEGKNVNNIKGVILHLHGLGSHFQFVYPNMDELSYRDNFFSKFGYKSFALEFFGHGKSQGERCYINDFNDLLIDLDTILEDIINKYPSKNIYILAESMGGAVILEYLIQNYCEKKLLNISGIILLSPLCGIDKNLKPGKIMSQIFIKISNLFPRINYSLNSSKLNIDSINNSEYNTAKDKCEYTYKGAHKLGTMRELLKISFSIPENVDKINKPIIIFHGLKDKITTPDGSIEVINKINILDKKIVLLEDSEHCLLVPKDNYDMIPSMIYSLIIEWLNQH